MEFLVFDVSLNSEGTYFPSRRRVVQCSRFYYNWISELRRESSNFEEIPKEEETFKTESLNSSNQKNHLNLENLIKFLFRND